MVIFGEVWVQHIEAQPRRGKHPKRGTIPAYAEFELDFQLRLPDEPQDGTTGLLQWNPVGCEMPMLILNIERDESVYMTLLWEPFNENGDPIGAPTRLQHEIITGRLVNVTVTLKNTTPPYADLRLSLDGVGDAVESILAQSESEIYFKEIHILMCGAQTKPSRGTLSHIHYRPLGDSRPSGPKPIRIERQDDFQLPLQDKRLLDEIQDEIEEGQKWQRFDMFFGFFLVTNSATLGVQIELGEKYPDFPWTLVEEVFLYIFSLEFVLRLVITIWGEVRQAQELGFKHPLSVGFTHGIYEITTDIWSFFDFLVILISILDIWVLNNMELPFPISVLRLVRLLKLAKMVRIIRAFRELGLLVECLFRGLATLTWTAFLLVIILYVGGIIMVKLARWADDDSDLFASVSGTMWRLLAYLTYDDWVSGCEHLAFTLGSPVATFIFLLFMAVGALGIMNLVIGVLCVAAFELTKRMDRMQGAESLMLKREAMGMARKYMKTYGNRPLFQNEEFISSGELFEMLFDPDFKSLLEILDMAIEDFSAAIAAFADHSGTLEIEGFIEALAVIMLQNHFLSSADIIDRGRDSAITHEGKVRPVDLLFYARGLGSCHHCLDNIEKNTSFTLSCVHDILHVLGVTARKHNSMYNPDELVQNRLKIMRDLHQQSMIEKIEEKDFETKYLELYLGMVKQHVMELAFVTPMDTFFGCWVVVAACFMGWQSYQSDDSGFNVGEFVVELFFTFLFSFEMIMRMNLFMLLYEFRSTSRLGAPSAGVRVKKSRSKEFDAFRHEEMTPQTMLVWKVFPRRPADGGFTAALMNFPSMLRDPWFVIDLFVVLIMILDNVIFTSLVRSGAVTIPQNFLSIVQILRMFRLLRLLKIVRLFPLLLLVAQALLSSGKLVFYASSIIFVIIYVAAIILRVIVGSDEEAMDEFAKKEFFSTLMRCFVTLWQFVTFDDWTEIFYSITSESAILGPLLIFLLIFLGLATMNLIVGIMCHTALSLKHKDEDNQHQQSMLGFLVALDKVRRILAEHFRGKMTKPLLVKFFDWAAPADGNDTRLMHEMEEAIGLEHSEPKSSVNSHEQYTPAVNSEQKRGTFLKTGGVGGSMRFKAHKTEAEVEEELFQALKDANLNKTFLQEIFAKIDFMKEDVIDRQSLIFGCMQVREDCSQLDMFCVKREYKEIHHIIRHVEKELRQIIIKRNKVIRQFEAVIHSHEYHEDPAYEAACQDEHLMPTIPYLVELDFETSQAIERLSDSYELSRPHSHAIENVSLVQGSGKIKNHDAVPDVIIGVDTKFRIEIAPQDMLVVEELRFDPTTQTDNHVVVSLLVKRIVTNTKLYVVTANTISVKPNHFKIAKKVEGKTMGFEQLKMEKHDMGSEPPTLCHLPSQTNLWSTPRTTQQMFNWDVATRDSAKKGAANKAGIAEELLVEWDRQMEAYVDTGKAILLSEAFMALKMLWKESRLGTEKAAEELRRRRLPTGSNDDAPSLSSRWRLGSARAAIPLPPQPLGNFLQNLPEEPIPEESTLQAAAIAVVESPKVGEVAPSDIQIQEDNLAEAADAHYAEESCLRRERRAKKSPPSGQTQSRREEDETLTCDDMIGDIPSCTGPRKVDEHVQHCTQQVVDHEVTQHVAGQVDIAHRHVRTSIDQTHAAVEGMLNEANSPTSKLFSPTRGQDGHEHDPKLVAGMLGGRVDYSESQR